MTYALRFDGRTVIVTGGTKGVGLGVARCFLEAGANVVVCARTAPEVEPAAASREALFVAADVREVGQIEHVVAKTLEHYGRIDVLVNNAGGAPFAEAATASPKFHEKVVALNLTAPLHFAQKVNAVMQQQPEGGSIINIASVSGARPSPGTAAYGAAKAGLLSLTRSLAVEWAPKVRINAITAGMIRTEQAHLHYGDEEGIARVAATVPLGRLGTPVDVANACLFLASDLASYVSGASLLLDGGGERPAFLDAAKGEKS